MRRHGRNEARRRTADALFQQRVKSLADFTGRQRTRHRVANARNAAAIRPHLHRSWPPALGFRRGSPSTNEGGLRPSCKRPRAAPPRFASHMRSSATIPQTQRRFPQLQVTRIFAHHNPLDRAFYRRETRLRRPTSRFQSMPTCVLPSKQPVYVEERKEPHHVALPDARAGFDVTAHELAAAPLDPV
jgi:hypothetical protein